jgi:thiol-disulfide isomerase/thioredoxin
MNRLATSFITLLTVLAVYLMSSEVFSEEREQPRLGYKMSELLKAIDAPEFTLEDMDETKFSLSAYKGKVVLLNFWATWCPPCRREMPSMERLHLNFEEEDFAVIAINQMEDVDDVFAYTGELEVDPTFTILFDPESVISEAYKVQGLPTTYLIDKKGRIRFRAIGGREFDHPEVEAQIRQLMKE